MIVDSTGPYKLSEGADFQTTLKITDSSLFPSSAIVVVFHKSREEIPKIWCLGDIIRLNDFTFKLFNGILNAKRPSNVKKPKLYLFSLEDGIAPYAHYMGTFFQSSEHYHLLASVRSWAKKALSQSVPDCLKNTRHLGVASGERDILAKVYKICQMGGPLDSISVICYE